MSKLLAIAHHLRNLCSSANQISVMDDSSYQDFECVCNRIESAVNMAATVGFQCRIWVDRFSDELKVIEVWDTETDEVIAKAVDPAYEFTADFRESCEIWYSRVKGVKS